MTNSPCASLVAGGGVAGVEALLTLRALAGDRCELILADARPDFIYRPMTVAQPFARGRAARRPTAAIARDVGARVVPDAVVAVDDGERIATTANGERLPYEALVLATGASAEPACRDALTWGRRLGRRAPRQAPARPPGGLRPPPRVRRPAWPRLAPARLRARADDRP